MPDHLEKTMSHHEMTIKSLHLPAPDSGSWVKGPIYPIDPPVKMKAGRLYMVGVRDGRGVVEPGESWLRWRWRCLRRRLRV